MPVDKTEARIKALYGTRSALYACGTDAMYLHQMYTPMPDSRLHRQCPAKRAQAATHEQTPCKACRRGSAPAEDVDGQHAQAADRLGAHDGLHGLVQDRVARVARGLRVAGHLREDVAHRVAGVRVPRAQHAQQPQDLGAHGTNRGQGTGKWGSALVAGHLRKGVAHCIAGVRVPRVQHTQQPQDLGAHGTALVSKAEYVEAAQASPSQYRVTMWALVS